VKDVLFRVPNDFPLESIPVCNKNVMQLQLDSPGSSPIDTIQISLNGDNLIRVEFDFHKNGWVIFKALNDCVDDNGNKQKQNWNKVAFIPAEYKWLY
jgi:hypothetical protein